MDKITLQQAPIIEYSALLAEGAKVIERLELISPSNLVITEETVKSIKKVRSELNNEFKDYESIRKSIKELVMQPYKDFEESYKLNIADKYNEAENTLKTSINEVESNIKKDKEEEAKKYFNDVNDNDFLKFEVMNLKVGLSDTIASLTKKVDEFIGKVKSDLLTIETLENKERILVKYHQLLELNTCIMQVNNDIKAEKELESARIERDKVQKAVEIKEKVETVQVIEEEITIEFTATSTKEKLIKLREFMKLEGIKYA